MHLDRTQRDGVVLILLSVLGYSVFPVFVRYIGDTGMQPLDIATWRFLFAAPFLWVLITLRGRRAMSIPLPRLKLLLSGNLMMVAAVSAMRGLELIPAAIYVLLFYSFPAMVALINLARGERLGRAAWLALGLTMIGVALTMPDLSAGLQQGANIEGAGLAILNAFVIAVYFIITSHLLRGCDDTPAASAWSISGALLPLVVLALARPLALPPSPQAWLLLAGLSAVSTVLPIVTLNAGIQRLGASRSAILSTLEPVLTLVWSVLLLGDVIREVQLVGGALIFVSVILLQLRKPQPSAVGDSPLGQDAAA